MTYLLLGAALVGAALVVRLIAEVVARRRGHRIPLVPTVIAGLVLLLLTAVFDTIMIGSGLVTYSESKILGPRIGLAPIEDFTYPIALVLLIPGLQELCRRTGRRR